MYITSFHLIHYYRSKESSLSYSPVEVMHTCKCFILTPTGMIIYKFIALIGKKLYKDQFNTKNVNLSTSFNFPDKFIYKISSIFHKI